MIRTISKVDRLHLGSTIGGRVGLLANLLRVPWIYLGSLLIFSLNRLINLAAMHGDLGRGVDSETDFVSANIDNRDHHVVADHDAFVAVSG
jgi:hypothetical protein